MRTNHDAASLLEDRWVRVHEWLIHSVAAKGSRPATAIPIVLTAGFAIGGYTAVPLAKELARGQPVYAPELPGFSRSTKPNHALDIPALADATAQWMDAMGLGRVVLAGSSFGAQVAAEFAVRHPRRLRGLVLIGPTIDPEARSILRSAMRLAVNSSREVASTPGMLRDYLESGPMRMARTARYAVEDRMEEKLPHIQAPTIIIRGERDPLVPQSWAEKAARLLPRGRLIVIRGKAHGIDRNAAKSVSSIIAEFAASLIPARRARESTGEAGAA